MERKFKSLHIHRHEAATSYSTVMDLKVLSKIFQKSNSKLLVLISFLYDSTFVLHVLEENCITLKRSKVGEIFVKTIGNGAGFSDKTVLKLEDDNENVVTLIPNFVPSVIMLYEHVSSIFLTQDFARSPIHFSMKISMKKITQYSKINNSLIVEISIDTHDSKGGNSLLLILVDYFVHENNTFHDMKFTFLNIMLRLTEI